MTRLTAAAAIAIVLLRLLTGWHFFNEGVKKFDPGFSSVGFLRTAKGPMAPYYRSMVKGPHGAFTELSQPVELGSADAADCGEWVEAIRESWDTGLVRLGRLGLDGEAADRVASLRDEMIGKINAYLETTADAIAENQHEAWRLKQLREEARRETPPPYLQARIAEKDLEVWAAMQPVVNSVEMIQEEYTEAAAAIAADSGISETRFRSAIEERSLSAWVDFAVKWTVLTCGVCVFLGIVTPLFATVAALFLLSLIMTQPPWVVGADLTAFFNWAVECGAFLVLATVGAGRWAGVDGLLFAMRRRYGDLSPAHTDGLQAPRAA